MTHQATENRVGRDAVESEIAEIARYLQEHLGQRATAYLSGLKDQKMVGQWAKGRVAPRDASQFRLRNGYHAARLISQAFGDETAKAWLFGTSRQLGGEAPAYVLRHSRLPDEMTPVVLAAGSFAEGGYAEEATEDAVEESSIEAQRFVDRIRLLEDAQEKIQQQVEDLAAMVGAGSKGSER